MPIPIAAAVAAGQALVFGANSLLQVKNNNAGRKWNERMYERQRSDALTDAQMQNEYNSPAAQMKRLTAAGLNENLVYGDGGATMQASPVRSSSVESWKPNAPALDFSGAGNSLMAHYSIEQTKQQTDNLKMQNEVLQQDALLKAAQTANTVAATSQTGVQTQQSALNLETAKQLQGTTIEQAKASLGKTLADTKFTLDQNERSAALQAPTLAGAMENVLNLRASRGQTEATTSNLRQQLENAKKDGTLKDLDIQLKQNGIQPGDPAYMRVLTQLFENGLDGKSIVPQTLKKIFTDERWKVGYWMDKIWK